MSLESPRAQWPSGHHLHWPSHYVHPTTEQGTCDKGPTQRQVPVPWPPEDPYLEEVSFNEDEFEDMEAENGSCQMAVRSNTSQIVVPWKNENGGF